MAREIPHSSRAVVCRIRRYSFDSFGDVGSTAIVFLRLGRTQEAV